MSDEIREARGGSAKLPAGACQGLLGARKRSTALDVGEEMVVSRHGLMLVAFAEAIHALDHADFLLWELRVLRLTLSRLTSPRSRSRLGPVRQPYPCC
jgi:hypothetical protein